MGAANTVTTCRIGSTPSIKLWRAENNHTSTVTTPAIRPGREAVACSTCTYLECALKSRRREYTVACSGAFRDISSRLEAYGVVEMERARSDLAMHRSVCASAI